MFDKIIELLTRFVEAHERQAESSAAYVELLKAQRVDCTHQEVKPAQIAQSDGTERTAGEAAEEKPKRTRKPKDQAPAEAPKSEGVEEMQDAAESPAQTLPPVDPKPETQAEPEITLEDLKREIKDYAKRRKAAGSATSVEDARALMAAFGDGATASDQVKAEFYPAVMAAIKADWAPGGEDEEL